MAHAKLSPSSAERWMSCPGSVALCEGKDDKGNQFAHDGTTMHHFAELCLTNGAMAKEYVGQTYSRDGFSTLFTADLATPTQTYVDQIRQLVESTGGHLLVEQKLPIADITGEAGAHGTSDAVILTTDELTVADLKGGQGVAVSAEKNPQLMLYALAAYHHFSLVQDFKTVRLVISQPRLNSYSEWAIPLEELLAFGEQVKKAAAITRLADAPLQASEKACKFCKAKATCPALTQAVEVATGAMFDDLTEPTKPAGCTSDDLANKMALVKLVEDWCKAVRAETERRLLAGEPVTGYKLVQGKQGNRKWADADEAEATLKGLRLKVEEMYDLSLISPTTAEKLAGAGTIGPRQWKKVIPLITRSEGSPSVAPESDKRPALVVGGNTDDFDVVQAAEDFV